MPKYDFKVVRMVPQKLEATLQSYGDEGFEVVGVQNVSNKIVCIMQKEKVGRPPKKKAAAKKK